MAPIYLKCTRCGNGTTNELSVNGVCRDCIVKEKVLPERTYYVRVMAKRYRYQVNKVRVSASQHETCARAEKNLFGKLRFWAPWMTGEDLAKYLHEARQEAEAHTVAHSKKVILVARKGDMLAADARIRTAKGLLSGTAQVGAGLAGPGRQITREEILRPNK